MNTHQSRLRLEALDARDLPSATTLDLTTRGSSGEINGAIFRQDDGQPAGPTNFRTFLRLQGAAGGAGQGYNTDARPLQFNENNSPNLTRSLRVGDLPRVFANGGSYRALQLDIQQGNSQPLLSLDQVKIFTAGAGNLGGYNRTAGTLAGLTPVFDLDADGDSWVTLNARLNSPSRPGDMVMLVPESAFAGATAGTYVYLYCKFGEHYAANGGIQEWAPGRPAATGTISGAIIDANSGAAVANLIVYIDANNNGSRDEGELYTYTDGNGLYTFTDLSVGTTGATLFRLRTDLAGTGWTPVSNAPLEVYLGPGDIVTGVDFYATGRIRGT